MVANLEGERRVYPLKKVGQKKSVISEIRVLGEKYHMDEIALLRTRDIAVADWVQLRCKYGCKKYATNWCCPPETPTPDQTKTLLQEYKKAFLLSGKIKNSEFHKDSQKKRRTQVAMWKGTVALERQLFLWGYYKAFALVSENCALCRQCTYPDTCIFPMYRRPSVESCSIDIFQTLRNIGKPFTIAHDVTEQYRCYSLILLE
jgi:predicted metal-binding protein